MKRAPAWIVLLFPIVALIRISGPGDLHEGDQAKQADYVLDILCSNNWIVQHHADGTVMTKPPLYNWLAAPMVMLFGAEEFVLKLPSLLAAFAAALMLFDLARRTIDARTAVFGAIFMLLTQMFGRQMYYARTDMLLLCFIVMQFWAIVRWQEQGKPKWLWVFWGAAALGNLTKGPLALLIPHMGLAAWWWWEGRLKQQYARLKLGWGILFSLLPLGIWFVAGCAKDPRLYHAMIQGEIVDRVLSNSSKSHENRHILYYIPAMLARTAPWSLLALVGLWFFPWRRPRGQDEKRVPSGVVLAVAWALTTLLFFSLIPSKRPDRIFPAVPPFCLLAGWVVSSFLEYELSESAGKISIATISLILSTFVCAGALAMCAAYSPEQLPEWGAFVHSYEFPRLVAENHILVVCAGALLIAAAIMTAVGMGNRNQYILPAGLILGALCWTVLDEHVLDDWIKTDLSRDAVAACRAARMAEKEQHAQVLILSGCRYPLRFHFLQQGPGLKPDELKKSLNGVKGAACVIGSLSFEKAGKHVAGTLEEAGVLNVGKLIFSVSRQDIPADQRLGVVLIDRAQQSSDR